MKVALLHELLTMNGGAERVLRIFADMFPDAPIYTLLWNPAVTQDWLDPSRIRTSHLQCVAKRIEAARRILRVTPSGWNHHLYLPWFPSAAEAWDWSDYDLVLSSSSAYAHGIITNNAPKHLCYVHAPARYLWDRTHDVQENANHGLLGPIRHALLSTTLQRLRVWDSETAARPDRLIAASKTVARRMELYWNIQAPVITPPLDDLWLHQPATRDATDASPFLIVSTLARYKRIDLAIDACMQADVPLIIAGDGPDKRRLQRSAHANIQFLGHCDSATLKRLYASARAVIFPGDEDFGLVPLEALSQGCPVIAWRGGGALETLQDHVTGRLFQEPTAASLAEVLKNFDHKKYSIKDCRTACRTAETAKFIARMQQEIQQLLNEDV